MIPGFPTFPFLFVAGAAVWISTLTIDAEESAGEVSADGSPTDADAADPSKEGPQATSLDLLELEVGYELIPLVDGEQSGLLDRIKALRRQFMTERGFPVPQIHIRDNLRLESKAYTIVVKGIEAGRGELRPGRFLAMNAVGTADGSGLPGEVTKEPAFGLPAVWVSAADRERAETMGYTVVDPETVLITHLSETIKRYAPDLLTRQDVQRLLDELGRDHPKVVEELIPHHCTVGGVQKVLQYLLREDVPVRDFLTVVETLADHAPQTKEPEALTEYVRQALCRTITAAYRDTDGVVSLMTLDPIIERAVRESVQEGLALDPQLTQQLVVAVRKSVETFTARGQFPVFLVSPGIRRHVRQLLQRYVPQMTVLSHNELADDVQVKSLGVVRWNDAN